MNRYVAITLALTGFLLASCQPEVVEPEVDPLTLDEIDAERLWERITEEAPYETYDYWPAEEGVEPGQAPHGPFHRILVNRTLLEALPVADRVAPDGSIIVKENMDTGREVTGYTVMAKVEGYDPEHGDWFWAKYGLDGSVDAAGRLESCIVCHAGRRDNDYIIVHPLDTPIDADE